MKKKREARMVSGRTIADACPNCLRKLDGVTAVTLEKDFKRTGSTGRVSLKGHPSMCMYCGAMLVFSDDEGHLRTMTAAERSSYRVEPVLEDVVNRLRPKPPDFTRKNYN